MKKVSSLILIAALAVALSPVMSIAADSPASSNQTAQSHSKGHKGKGHHRHHHKRGGKQAATPGSNLD